MIQSFYSTRKKNCSTYFACNPWRTCAGCFFLLSRYNVKFCIQIYIFVICYSYAYCSINEWYNGIFYVRLTCHHCFIHHVYKLYYVSEDEKKTINDCAMPLLMMRVVPQNKTVFCFISFFFIFSFCIEFHCGFDSNFWNGRVKLTCGC